MEQVIMDPKDNVLSVTVRLPCNVPLIKFWGLREEALALPHNTSSSISLDPETLSVTATVCASATFARDRIWQDGKEVPSAIPQLQAAIAHLRKYTPATNKHATTFALHMATHHNVPGAPHSCFDVDSLRLAALVYAASFVFGIGEEHLQHVCAAMRLAGGAACRSLYGGVVQWNRGYRPDGLDSTCQALAPAHHWPDLAVVLLPAAVVPGDSTRGPLLAGRSLAADMARTADTSALNTHRYSQMAPARGRALESALLERDFAAFAELVTAESNTLQACMQDTSPPLFNLNDTSRRVIEMVHRYNAFKKRTAVAYTFEAGPDAVLFFQKKDAVEVFQRLLYHFPPPSAADGSVVNLQEYFTTLGPAGYLGASYGGHLISGWEDVAGMQPPPEVYADVYASTGGEMGALVLGAEADPRILAAGMRWPGALAGIMPLSPGTGAARATDPSAALLNPRTGQPFGYATGTGARQTVEALMASAQAKAAATGSGLLGVKPAQPPAHDPAGLPLPLPGPGGKGFVQPYPPEWGAGQVGPAVAGQVLAPPPAPPAGAVSAVMGPPSAGTPPSILRLPPSGELTDTVSRGGVGPWDVGGQMEARMSAVSLRPGGPAPPHGHEAAKGPGGSAGPRTAWGAEGGPAGGRPGPAGAPLGAALQAVVDKLVPSELAPGSATDKAIAELAAAANYPPHSLMGLLLRDPAFSLFARMAACTGVDSALASTDGIFTVFCPSTHSIMSQCRAQGLEVEAVLARAGLRQWVEHHVHLGAMAARDLVDGFHLNMQSGAYYPTSRRGAGAKGNTIGRATIQAFDIRASNGVVHAISVPVADFD